MSKEQKNKRVPKLRFPEFEDVGEWSLNLLGDLVEVVSKRNNYNQVSRVFTNSAANGIIDQRDFFDKDIATKGNTDNYFVVEKGDYVYNPRISEAAPVGPTSRNKLGKGIVSPLYTVFRFRNNDNDFYEHYFKSSHWERNLQAIGNKGARHDRMSISLAQFLQIQVLAPCIDEQQKIADCLSSLDELITANTQKLEALKVYKKGLMQQLFPAEGETVPKLRFAEFRNNGEWDANVLGGNMIASFVSEKITVEELKLETYVSTENMLSDYQGIVKATRTPATGSFTRFKKGDVLLSNIRPYLKKVWFANVDGAASNDVIIIWAGELLEQSFLSFLLKNDSFINYIMRGAEGVKMPRGDKDLIKDYPLMFPRRDEQRKIALCLSSLEELITAQAEKIEQLKTHKKGLMQQLFPSINDVSE